MGIGWLAMIPAIILAVVPYLIIKKGRWWPGAFGWMLIILAIGVLASEGFRNLGPVGLAGIFFGTVLGFAGLLGGPSSPAR
ncbi:MAG: hypothetical protein HXX08_01875 [Chloroflexi bacterium]|uniref:Uncharacterized protein n=1 Tax=Candidatus Chlorohelix allophototropha TaxID=3003348 RepID=A0A8T7LUN5_9CHLR|nr:hypothetical protein [Chloroflexota bacterium]WJW66492.1 hypothetical protein OZ401_002295 [Chloroflexota bacterium L227-S17]